MCVWLSQRRRERCTTSSDAPRAAQRCMAMRAVCLATAVSWPHALLNRSSACSKEYDSRPTCMMPAESCSRLSRRFTTFLSMASILLAASDFFETFVRRAPGRARRASYNKRHLLYAICPRGAPVPHSAARASLLPRNKPASYQRRLSDGCRARSDDDDSLLNKSSTALRGEAGSRFRLPDDVSRSRSTESNKADRRAGSDAWSRSCKDAESFLRRLSRFLTKRLTFGNA